MLENPQKEVIVLALRIATPRKPNSARRKTIKNKTKLNKLYLSYVPGGAHSLKIFGTVLIQGSGPRDLPQVHTKGIRGYEDLKPVFDKNRRRSFYGVKKPKFMLNFNFLIFVFFSKSNIIKTTQYTPKTILLLKYHLFFFRKTFFFLFKLNSNVS